MDVLRRVRILFLGRGVDCAKILAEWTDFFASSSFGFSRLAIERRAHSEERQLHGVPGVFGRAKFRFDPPDRAALVTRLSGMRGTDD